MDLFCVYFENKAVYFVPTRSNVWTDSIFVGRNEVLTPTKLLKNLENRNSLTVVSDDVTGTFYDFCLQFEPVEAAGGVVANRDGDILMMRRRGWWDLPKGHVEEGETHPQAALREVEEETGLRGVEIGDKITSTLHFYIMRGRWELKKTTWYRMKYSGGEQPVPQTEEGIAEIRWLHGSALQEALVGAYSTIRNVFDVYLQS